MHPAWGARIRKVERDDVTEKLNSKKILIKHLPNEYIIVENLTS